jgi:hypothetical protein
VVSTQSTTRYLYMVFFFFFFLTREVGFIQLEKRGLKKRKDIFKVVTG